MADTSQSLTILLQAILADPTSAELTPADSIFIDPIFIDPTATDSTATDSTATDSTATDPAVVASLTSTARQSLITELLADRWQVQAFGITPNNVNALFNHRLALLRSIYPSLATFCREQFGWQTCPIDLLWRLWLPLALQLSTWHKAIGRCLIQGILGGQGTGKTTLTVILAEILAAMGLQVCRLSIDDLYKTYQERQQLQQIDPRWRWRGPPGTHDVALGLAVLRQLRDATTPRPIAIPRFDKSAQQGAGDRSEPDWVSAADIVLFEGWFVGVRPIDPIAFETAPPPINTEADRQFARDVNARLADYLPLWDLLDRLIILYPSDYRLSQQWRQHAEQQMIAAGKAGMSDAEIEQFVQYFWRSLHPDLFITPLLNRTDRVDLVVEIDADHRLIQVDSVGN